MGRGNHRILATGNVAAHTVDRNVLVPQHDPRKRFHFDLLHGVVLHLCKVADLLLRELDVRNGLFRKLCNRRRDFFLAEPEDGLVPVVKLLGQFLHSGIAPRFNVCKNLLHRLPHLRVLRLGLLSADAVFEVPNHGDLL